MVLPQGSVKSDWEVELGVVIGSTARYVSEADALAHVAGYCVVNDVSEREYQLERGGTVGQGQGLRHLRPGRPVAGHRRRGAATRRTWRCGWTSTAAATRTAARRR
ncbi:MAG: fumarylacetoacetate hydrolase family protein [Comamonadaceae bacterium]|nr:fumarylacetoacetate hydrolase family protein [Comamonadaceae bacterium]